MKEQLLTLFNNGQTLAGDSDLYPVMSKIVEANKKLLFEMNTQYLTPSEVNEYMARIIGQNISSSVRITTPFYTDFGANIHLGEDIYFNRGVQMQDQGGIYIGDGCLIGHQVIFATLDHDLDPKKRSDLHPAPIVVEKNVWIGSNATILKGVRIGEGAIVSAGSLVNKDVPANSVVAGVPAKVIKNLNK